MVASMGCGRVRLRLWTVMTLLGAVLVVPVVPAAPAVGAVAAAAEAAGDQGWCRRQVLRFSTWLRGSLPCSQTRGFPHCGLPSIVKKLNRQFGQKTSRSSGRYGQSPHEHERSPSPVARSNLAFENSHPIIMFSEHIEEDVRPRPRPYFPPMNFTS